MMGKRLFVAIELPESIKRLLVNLDPQIHGARWLDAEQMHLTLGFFGVVPENVDLKLREKLSAIVFGAFFLPIVGVGTFPPKGPPKIIWLGVGLEPELRPFHPHVTLARCQRISPQSVRKFLKANVDLDAGMIRVDSFHLYSSKLTPAGPIHTRELTVHCSRGR